MNLYFKKIFIHWTNSKHVGNSLPQSVISADTTDSFKLVNSEGVKTTVQYLIQLSLGSARKIWQIPIVVNILQN